MPAISSKAYKAGELIFECNPIIHCIANAFKSKICDNCLDKSDSLKKCAQCHQMYYCGRDCQQNDWKYHKNECKIYRNPNFLMNSSIIMERLLLRLYLCVKFVPNFTSKRHQLFNGKDFCLNEINCVLTGLVSDTLTMELFSSFCSNFQDYGLTFDSRELLHWFGMLCICRYNFELHEYTDNPSELRYSLFEEPTGAGLYFQNLSVDHSCLPNADLVTNGLKLHVRAMKSISPTEEITMAMVPLGQNKSGRQRSTQRMCLPLCECERCKLNLDKDIDYEEYRNLYRKHKYHWNLIGDHLKASVFSYDYQMDVQLMIYFRKIYGQYSVVRSEELVLSFYCFTTYSQHSSKPLIKLWYNQIEPIVLITHSSEHPSYKLLQNIYKTSI